MSKEWEALVEEEFCEFCFVKCDISGHSIILSQHPQKKVIETLEKFGHYIEVKVNQYDGRLWTWQGDGGLIAFLGREKTNDAIKFSLDIINNLDSFNNDDSMIQEDIKLRLAVHLGTANYREQTGHIHSVDVI